MVGACTCPEGGIVLNFSRMNKILKFNPIDMTMTVQPGAILADIKKAAEAYFILRIHLITEYQQ